MDEHTEFQDFSARAKLELDDGNAEGSEEPRRSSSSRAAADGESRSRQDGGKKVRRRKKRKRHSPRWESAKTRSRKVSKLVARGGLIMGVASLVTILICVVIWYGNQLKSPATTPKPERTQVKQVNWISPGEEEALLKARAAIEVRDPALVADHFHPSAQEPGEMIDFLEGMAREMGAGIRLSWVGDIGRGEQALTGVLITPGYRSTRMRLALLTPDDQGTWKLDFDALACSSSPDWETVAAGEADSATVRTVLAPGYYYNGPYSEEQWACYRLRSLNSDIILYGYCRRETAQHFALEKILSRSRLPTKPAGADPDAADAQAPEAQEASPESTSPESELPADLPPVAEQRPGPGHRAILRLKHSPEAIGKQYEIVEVLASDWVMTGKPYDHHFIGVRELIDVRSPLE